MNACLSISAEQHFLSEALEPIKTFLDDPGVVEISCQRSNEIWLERIGQLSMVRQAVDGLDQEAIRHMASRAASFTKQTVNAENPLLSSTLVDGERVQFVLNPTSATGHAFSIRKQFIRRFDLGDYEKAGAFRFTKVTGDDYIDDVDIELSRLLRAGRARGFLELAAVHHRSMLISGGTSTGKTTFLNTMLTAIPNNERFVLMQDTAELEPCQENVVSLLVSKGGQGEARVTMTDLLASALRLRPDRIFMGELRGDEAFDFINAINTGHPGSMSTIHANSPHHAFNRLSTLVLNSNVRMERDDIIRYIRSIIPIVVQLKKSDAAGGRGVSEIYFADEVDEDGKRRHGHAG
ncbi:P-type DNA transfer ATPase VirB11 [Rhizobium sp. VS19-DR104.2]|uniref:P-type DNA transfer ATPase VirB11 n=1 Tax=unclassified Rhizobium TaxID=2613769 RepID=UPI001ADC305C|nr:MULTISPECIES: P-type DNA transfer ATPase VirB11 [unclassified Rhizobium]MBO9102256.1 P-type DNA transfer ATPase VirB11 [Rhizobium sp. L58/93]MBO9135299.1 P-type DNA transfer ATPase VirB11 [Rhizobium sp. B209b/85]MBO9171528.1 P-type DNA transfer ATPase VirB11 [Rhizobium sp. L245/93]MBO9187394.1 P-type DNA transfer ATPase VirB11 [Rhizobium sp. E27B/91]MBZ5763119.1 P-type DNA transfer ATPase VirB11 [Rhizobium sp. VS19-DR96]